MKKLRVNTTSPYDVIIGSNLLDDCGRYIAGVTVAKKAVVITDGNVAPLYLDRVMSSLRGSGIAPSEFMVAPGEDSKSPQNLIAAAEFCLHSGLDRSDLIVALGGGVVGDLAGFCASIYSRGVNLVQLPTTLLSQVDSSVGGKTAVNLESGKNMIGTFYQPSLVLCDTDTVTTLKPDIFSDGCAEVIKYAVLCGGRLYEIVKSDISENLESVIYECLTLKSAIVTEDERDTGKRKLLNLGHTIGHAAERQSGFALSHGKSVAIGLCMTARACAVKGYCTKECAGSIVSLCRQYGLPTVTGIPADPLYSAAINDKKRSGDTISLVLIRDMGDCVISDCNIGSLKELIRLGYTECDGECNASYT